MLYDTESERVNLNEKIDCMTQYIELMKLCVADNTKVKANFSTFSEHYEITPLLDISLIKNFYKHGIC